MSQRATLRRAEREQKKDEVKYTLTGSQLYAIRQEIKKEYDNLWKQGREEILDKVAKEAFKLILCIPVMVIHDKLDLLTASDNPELLFAEECANVYLAFQNGNITLEELEEGLYEETGIRFYETTGHNLAMRRETEDAEIHS